ncbi:MAG TPA: hypothetical protein VGM01_08485 [Ktedonobacteraceae bacterium]
MAKDAYGTAALSTREAASGAIRSLLLSGGQQVTVSIPAGVYEGQVLWFPGYVRENEHDTQPGTLFLTVQVVAEQSGEVPQPAPDPIMQVTPPLLPPLAPSQARPTSSTPTRETQRSPLNPRIMLALAALLIIVSSGATFLVVYTTRSIAQVHALSATATSLTSGATATGIVQGTQMASSATATVQAQATAAVVAANPDPYAHGTLIIDDQLNGTEDQLTRDRWTETSGCTFSGGALHVLDTDPKYLKECQAPGTIANGNFTLEVTANILRGDTAQILFRGDSLLQIGYFFSIDSTGAYSLLRLGSITLTSTGYTTLLHGTSQAIGRGYHQSNRLAVVALGSAITIYVNGQKIGGIFDNNFTDGEIGLIASSYINHTGSTEVAFTKLRIWQTGN